MRVMALEECGDGRMDGMGWDVDGFNVRDEKELGMGRNMMFQDVNADEC